MTECVIPDFDTAFAASLTSWRGELASRPRKVRLDEAYRRARDDTRLLRPDAEPPQTPYEPPVHAAGRAVDVRQRPSEVVPPRLQQTELPVYVPAESSSVEHIQSREFSSEWSIAKPGAEVPPAGRVKGKKCGQPKLFTEDLLDRVLNALDGQSSAPARDKAMVSLTTFAGFRPCEVAGLMTRTLVNASGELLDHITVMPGTAKRGRQRSIPMDPRLRTELSRFLREYPKAERIAFRITPNGRYSYSNAPAVSKWFLETYAKMGLVGFSAMSGRHSFADGLYRLGVQADVIQELMGHARLATTRIYLRPQPIALEVINRLGRSD